MLCACVGFGACAEQQAVPDGCAPGAAPTLEIGRGEADFEAIADGRVELIHGIQGGYHTTMALRAEALPAPDEAVEVELRGYLDGEELSRAVSYTRFLCDEDAQALEAWGLRLIWEATPEDLAGQMVRIEAVVTSDDGSRAEAATEAVIHDPLLEDS
ncbi:MAG: hypothetical protein Tsb0020_09260 [Haliangiales bacterium]